MHTNEKYPPHNNSQTSYRIVLSKNLDVVHKFKKAFIEGDDIYIGSLLGYPLDCSHFFQKVWNRGFIDPMWQMAQNSRNKLYKNKRHIVFGYKDTFPLTGAFLRIY